MERGESSAGSRASYRWSAGAGRNADGRHVMVWAVVGVVGAILVCTCTVTLMRKRGRAR
jgi:hypothetical protein